MGSLNFGIFPLAQKYDNWQHDWEKPFLEMTQDFIFPNTFKTIEYALKHLGEAHGTRFEFECYDLGHLYNLAYFVDKGLIKPPFLIQMIYGILGGVGADPDNLMHMHTIARNCLVMTMNGQYWQREKIKCRLAHRQRCWAVTCALGWRIACTLVRVSWRNRMRNKC